MGCTTPVLFTASVYFTAGDPNLGQPVMTLPTHLYSWYPRLYPSIMLTARPLYWFWACSYSTLRPCSCDSRQATCDSPE